MNCIEAMENCVSGGATNLEFEGEISTHMIKAMIEVGNRFGIKFRTFKTLPSTKPLKATNGFLYVFRERFGEGNSELPDVFWENARRVHSEKASEVGGTLRMIAGPEPIYYC